MMKWLKSYMTEDRLPEKDDGDHGHLSWMFQNNTAQVSLGEKWK